MIKEYPNQTWDCYFSTDLQQDAIGALEAGALLFFPNLAFEFLPEEAIFLSPKYVAPQSKNISYNPRTKSLRCAPCATAEQQQLTHMLQRFSDYATRLIHGLLPSYTNAIRQGRTSYRPVEIAGRLSSYRKDDTRLHVDAFPATPNQGERIIRVFSNVNPHGQPRHWRIGEPFTDVAKRFLPKIRKPWPGSAVLLKALGITKGRRTEYDHIMLQIHDRMKADLTYQKEVAQTEIFFPPGSSWIVQTDVVSHAAMAGQYIFEQTFALPVDAMVNPNLSPLRILEELTQRTLV